MFITALFTKPNFGISLGVHQLMNGLRRGGMHAQWSIIQQ
jgi:hypothetical protein